MSRRLLPLVVFLASAAGCTLVNSYPTGAEQELELCFNELDDDFDGLEDCADPDCASFCVEVDEERCGDGVDNDSDGAADCDDASCAVVCPAEALAPVSDWAGPDGSGVPPIEGPNMTPCPTGWREVEVAGVVTCDPWPATGREDCAPGDVHLPGTPGCVPVGMACPPSGEYPALDAGQNPVYVRAGAVGGDGLRGSPLGTVQEAVAGLGGTFGTVVIAPGDYDVGLVSVDHAIVFMGLCARGTTLRGRFEVSEGTLTLEELTVLDPDGPAVIAVNSTLLLDRVVIRGARESGVWTVGGDVRAFDVSVEGTRARALTGDRGQGFLLDGSSAGLERISVVGNATAGVQVRGAAALVGLGDFVALSTVRGNNSVSGYGVIVERSANLAVTNGALEGNAAGAVRVQTSGSARFTHSVLRVGSPSASQVITAASSGGGGLTLERCVVDGIDGPALFVDGSQFDAFDVVVQGAPERRPSGLPTVLVAGGTAKLDLARVVLDRRGQDGIIATEGAVLTADDVSFLEGLRADDNPLWVRAGGSLLMTRGHIVGGHRGIAADSVMPVVADTGLLLFDTLVEGSSGPGLLVLDGVSLDGDGLVVRDAVGAGISSRTSTITLSNLIVRGVTPDDLDCRRGMDLVDVDLTLDQSSIMGADEFGVAMLGGAATLEDVLLDLGRPACEGSPCTFRGAASLGVGFAHYSGLLGQPPAGLFMTDVRIANAGACGLHYEDAASEGLLRVSVVDTTSAVCSVADGAAPDGIWEPGAETLDYLAPVTPIGHCVPETILE